MVKKDLNEKAKSFVRANAALKGKPNMTTADFCKWVNKNLLPNSTLEPGFPRHISIETGRKWLHNLCFEVLTAKKAIFIDGHERPDVITYRTEDWIPSFDEDQSLQWGLKGSRMMKPKSKDAGIMVSDFIDERNGFLVLNDEEYEG